MPDFQFEFADETLEKKNNHWKDFLIQNCDPGFDQKIKIQFNSDLPLILDIENRKFQIDFINDKTNYHKKKLGLKTEPLAKALGSGAKGFNVLDLSAGLGIDTIFMSQLGFNVIAVERNPIIFMALKCAEAELGSERKVKFYFSEAIDFLKKINRDGEKFDLGYFDPMFPVKKKSALPRQEMVMFKNLVGEDTDSSDIVQFCLEAQIFKRLVVKRPIAAAPILKPAGSVEGKIIRYDIYS